MLTEGFLHSSLLAKFGEDAEWYLKSINALGSLACMTSLRIEMVIRHMVSCSIGEFLRRLVGSLRLRPLPVTGARLYDKTGHFLPTTRS